MFVSKPDHLKMQLTVTVLNDMSQTFQYIHTLPQYLPFVQNWGMHLCCLNNRMNECCVFVVPTGATVLCHTQDGRVKDNIPIAQWAVTRGLGELESNFGNLDILPCTSHTENCAEHILSHQKTRNSVNTSTAAVRNYKWKEQTCQRNDSTIFIFCQKGTKRVFLLQSD